MFFDLTDGKLTTRPDPPVGVSPALAERLTQLARDCILSPLDDGRRPSPEPDEEDYSYALEALGVVFRDKPGGIQDDAWPQAEFRLAYTTEFLRAELRAAAKLGAKQDRIMASLQAAETWRVNLLVDGPDLIRFAFEDDLDELAAALNETEGKT